MDFFPKDLPGLAWSVMKTPKFATRTQTSVSGRQLRVADYPFPIWTWTLTYEFLRDQHDTRFGPALGTGHDELREIMGFFARQQGGFQPFLYDDPTDDLATNQGLGVGDGHTTAFQLVRTLSSPTTGGLFTEPITQPIIIVGVFLNGASIINASQGGPPNWTLGANGLITFNPAPGAGVQVNATFTYCFPVHFLADEYEFENFMYQLWTLKKLQFESVILP